MILTTTPTVEGRQIKEYKGVDVDYEALGEANGMLMVIASGTAVVIE